MRTVYLFGGKRGLGHWSRAVKLNQLLDMVDPGGLHVLCTYEPRPACVPAINSPVVQLPDDVAAARRTLQQLVAGHEIEILIIDNRPEGPRDLTDHEMLWRLIRERPGLRVVLATRDVLDCRSVIRSAWRQNGIVDHLRRFFDVVWCFGDESVYDIATEYGLARSGVRCQHLGYLPPIEDRSDLLDSDHLIVVTAGGGFDAPWLDEVMAGASRCVKPGSVLLTLGPQHPAAFRWRSLARRNGVDVCDSVKNLAARMGRANLVIGMAGYNTVSEALWGGTRLLVVPRRSPTMEQQLRAERLQRRGVLDLAPTMTADIAAAAIGNALQHPRETVAHSLEFVTAARLAAALAR